MDLSSIAIITISLEPSLVAEKVLIIKLYAKGSKNAQVKSTTTIDKNRCKKNDLIRKPFDLNIFMFVFISPFIYDIINLKKRIDYE